MSANLSHDDIVRRLHDYMIAELVRDGSIQEVAAGDNLFMTGVLDPMPIAQMVQHIESSFDIHVPPIDFTLENFMSLDAMASYIAGRLQDSAGG